jgi:UDP-glucose 4-epimerase
VNIVVTGGAGFIGSHLVERLARESSEPIVVFDNLSRSPAEEMVRRLGNVVLHLTDIRDRNAVAKAMEGCELLFHLAAQSRVISAEDNLDDSFAANVEGTYNILRAARMAGVRRVVFTSSREVYGDPAHLPVSEGEPLLPKNAYGASKAAGEMLCRMFNRDGLETVVLRLANAYGSHDKDRVIPIFIEKALRGDTLTLYGGDQIVDFVWVDTVVDALLRAGFGSFIREPVNIASGHGTTIAELSQRILHLTESRSPRVIKPARELEVSSFVADTTRARTLLGIDQPHDPLFHLEDVIEWTRSRMPKMVDSGPSKTS